MSIWTVEFWVGFAFLGIVPFGMAVYGGHVAAESILDSRHRRNVRLKFLGIGILGLVIAFVYQYRTMKTEAGEEMATQTWKDDVDNKLRELLAHPLSSDQKKKALDLKREVAGTQRIENPPQEPKPIVPPSGHDNFLSSMPKYLLSTALKDAATRLRSAYQDWWEGQDRGLDMEEHLARLSKSDNLEDIKKRRKAAKDFYAYRVKSIVEETEPIRLVAIAKTVPSREETRQDEAISQTLKTDGYGGINGGAYADNLEELSKRLMRQ
jgi:chromatin remodeling complex protein RSC6